MWIYFVRVCAEHCARVRDECSSSAHPKEKERGEKIALHTLYAILWVLKRKQFTGAGKKCYMHFLLQTLYVLLFFAIGLVCMRYNKIHTYKFNFILVQWDFTFEMLSKVYMAKSIFIPGKFKFCWNSKLVKLVGLGLSPPAINSEKPMCDRENTQA